MTGMLNTLNHQICQLQWMQFRQDLQTRERCKIFYPIPTQSADYHWYQAVNDCAEFEEKLR